MSTFRTYAQLCRLPAVFTAMADVFLGYALTNQDLRLGHVFGRLLFASSALYLAGMVFNDYFDRDIDAIERPGRPIPSGRVSAGTARWIAIGLMTAGVVVAIGPSSNSQAVAMLLAAAILLYDGWAKNTPIGPLVMGSCRALNILLGASMVSSGLRHVLAAPQGIVAVAMGTYVAGVTWFARKEAEQSGRGGLIFGQTVINLSLVLLAAFIAPQMQPVWQSVGWTFSLAGNPTRTLLMLGVVAVVVNRRALAALSDPRPPIVQSAVRIMLLSIITIDATLIYAALGDPGVPIAIGVVALLVPSFVLGRWMTMT